MYKKYRLLINEEDAKDLLAYSGMHTPIAKKNTEDEVAMVLNTDNANWIMDTWFPLYDADVFLSHSHNDYCLAKKLAVQFESVGLKVFIDSEVWGYANDLLQKIDNEYCVKRFDNDGSKVYSYEKRNQTTAQINIILAHALMRMIDLTECFIFLETQNSVANTAKGKVETMSPWLFHELNVVSVIEQKLIARQSNFAEDSAMEKLSESVTGFKYTANTTNMPCLSYAKLKVLLGEARVRHNILSDNSQYGLNFLDAVYEKFV